MMPLFDIAYLVQQQNRQAAAVHEAPMPPSAPRLSNTRSMDDQQSNAAREQYYQLHREPIQRPWYYRKRMLPFAIVMTVFSTVLSCVMLAVTLTRKSIFMMKSHPTKTITLSAITMTTHSTTKTSTLQDRPNVVTISSGPSLSLTTMLSAPPSMTTLS
ncbi:hypothetical protein CI102_4705 [Trichoderma harzianum]|nr:hypothetical protein CI102_4705 [Trichoderma harzianum]